MSHRVYHGQLQTLEILSFFTHNYRCSKKCCPNNNYIKYNNIFAIYDRTYTSLEDSTGLNVLMKIKLYKKITD